MCVLESIHTVRVTHSTPRSPLVADMTRSCERAQRLATCRCACSRGLRTFKVVTRQRQIRDRRAWLCKRRELMIISIHLQKAHRVVPCSEGCKESLFICRTLTAYPLGELKIISASLFIFQEADRVSSNDAHQGRESVLFIGTQFSILYTVTL